MAEQWKNFLTDLPGLFQEFDGVTGDSGTLYAADEKSIVPPTSEEMEAAEKTANAALQAKILKELPIPKDAQAEARKAIMDFGRNYAETKYVSAETLMNQAQRLFDRLYSMARYKEDYINGISNNAKNKSCLTKEMREASRKLIPS